MHVHNYVIMYAYALYASLNIIQHVQRFKPYKAKEHCGTTLATYIYFSKMYSELGMAAWVYYDFQIVYYAFEQCSKIFRIMSQLCSVVPNYAP